MIAKPIAMKRKMVFTVMNLVSGKKLNVQHFKKIGFLLKLIIKMDTIQSEYIRIIMKWIPCPI